MEVAQTENTTKMNKRPLVDRACTSRTVDHQSQLDPE
jgi:hypothetical protein